MITQIGEDPKHLILQLTQEHAALEARLSELRSHRSLTPAEQLEVARIKKLKLAKKDQILRARARL